jgi:Spy/CpxP family protein refolding chaperone
MNIRNTLLTLLIVIAVAVPLTSMAQAGPGGGYGHGPSGRGGGPEHGLGFFDRALPRLAEELELSDEQTTQIEAIVDAARPAIDEYLERLESAREAYRATHDDPTDFDEYAFRTHAESQHEIQIELMVLVQKTKAQVLQVLTPEQIDQLEAMRGGFGKRIHRHPKRW